MNLFLKESPKGLFAEIANSTTPIPHMDTSKYTLIHFKKEIKGLLEVSSLKNEWSFYHNLTKALIISNRLTDDEAKNDIYIKKQVKHWDSVTKGIADEIHLVKFIKILNDFLQSEAWKKFLKDNLEDFKISSYRLAIFGMRTSLSIGIINFTTPLSLVNKLSGGIQYHQIDRAINIAIKRLLEGYTIIPTRHIQSELYPFSNGLFANITSKEPVRGSADGVSPKDAVKRPRSYFVFETVNVHNHLHISF